MQHFNMSENVKKNPHKTVRLSDLPKAHRLDCLMIAEQDKEQMNAKSGHARKCEPKNYYYFF